MAHCASIDSIVSEKLVKINDNYWNFIRKSVEIELQIRINIFGG